MRVYVILYTCTYNCVFLASGSIQARSITIKEDNARDSDLEEAMIAVLAAGAIWPVCGAVTMTAGAAVCTANNKFALVLRIQWRFVFSPLVILSWWRYYPPLPLVCGGLYPYNLQELIKDIPDAVDLEFLKIVLEGDDAVLFLLIGGDPVVSAVVAFRGEDAGGGGDWNSETNNCNRIEI